MGWNRFFKYDPVDKQENLKRSKRVLEMSREDLCFAIDVLISEHRENISSPYIWRLLGTVDFITETLDDAKDFWKMISVWENMHGSFLKKAIKNYPNFHSIID